MNSTFLAISFWPAVVCPTIGCVRVRVTVWHLICTMKIVQHLFCFLLFIVCCCGIDDTVAAAAVVVIFIDVACCCWCSCCVRTFGGGRNEKTFSKLIKLTQFSGKWCTVSVPIRLATIPLSLSPSHSGLVASFSCFLFHFI